MFAVSPPECAPPGNCGWHELVYVPSYWIFVFSRYPIRIGVKRRAAPCCQTCFRRLGAGFEAAVQDPDESVRELP